jgi:hypothetical protein
MEDPKPKLTATFELDDDGEPKKIMQGDLSHYIINVGVDDPPPDTYAVTYKLHPSYYDPIREVRSKDNQFEENLTSYGDFQVQADLRTGKRVEAVAANLSEALQRGYEGKTTPQIAAAISAIKQR